MMKIGIDARALETAHRFRGIGSYAKSLITALSRVDLENEYVFYCQKKPSPGLKLVGSNPRFTDYQVGHPKDTEGYNWSADQVYLPLAFKRSKVDLVHILDQSSVPMIKNVKTIVTIHDLIQLQESSHPSFKTKIKIAPASRADLIIADSVNTKKEILKHYKIRANKIKVIYLGYNKEEFQPEKDQQKIRNFKKTTFGDETTKYVLSIGFLDEERKNIQFLIEVFSKLLKQLKDEKLKLVLIGKKNDHSPISRFIQENGMQDQVILTDFVSDFTSYLQSADVFCFPSLSEGFGLPPLEAMACGVPVVSSNRTSLPEVVGDGGVLLDPTNHQSWVEALKKILTDKLYSQKLRENGLKQAAKFSWEKTAQETLKVYQEVYHDHCH